MDTHDAKCEYQPSGIDSGMDSCCCRERKLAKRVNALRELCVRTHSTAILGIHNGRPAYFITPDLINTIMGGIGEREDES